MKKVEIHWIDSMSTSGWQDADTHEDTDLRVESVGYLVKEYNDSYVITTSYCKHNGIVMAPFKIPKAAVTGFWELV